MHSLSCTKVIKIKREKPVFFPDPRLSLAKIIIIDNSNIWESRWWEKNRQKSLLFLTGTCRNQKFGIIY